MKKITILTFIMSLMVASSVMAQTTYYVSAAGGTPTDGATGSETLPFVNVGLAINASVPGDTIIIDGTAGPVNQNIQSNINGPLTFIGTGSPSAVINGSGVAPGNRMFNVQTGEASFSGITFTGVVDGNQGSVMTGQVGTTIVIDDCVFDNNGVLGANGGAIYIPSGILLVSNSLFKNNSAVATPLQSSRRGGAIFANGTSYVTIVNSTFYNNTSGRGGAIYMAVAPEGAKGALTLTNCTIAANSITDSNIVRSGGVRVDANIDVIVNNSLIYGNTYESAEIDPITGMPVGTSPSDMFVIAPAIGSTATTTVNNSIFGYAGGAILTGTVSNSETFLTALVLDYTDIAAGTDEFVKYADATYPVLWGDPALLAPITTDQAGNPRTAGNDAGAWASGFTNPVLSTTSNELASSLSVFYTQSNKSINIVNPLNVDLSIEVYNLLGTKVLSLGKIESESPISVSSLNSGLYLLLAKSVDGASTTKKFIIN